MPQEISRPAEKNHQFLVWIADVPYMITWLVEEGVGTLYGTLAGDFIGAKNWSRRFPVFAVGDVGLTTWAMEIAAMEHAGAAGQMRSRAEAQCHNPESPAATSFEALHVREIQ